MIEQKVCMLLTGIEMQVCSPVLAQHLKAIGIPQHSEYFFWRGRDKPSEEPIDHTFFSACIRLHHQGSDCVQYAQERWSAYTSAELGAMLPPLATTRRFLDCPTKWLCTLAGVGGYAADTEADARAKLLLRLYGVMDPDLPLDLPDSPLSQAQLE